MFRVAFARPARSIASPLARRCPRYSTAVGGASEVPPATPEQPSVVEKAEGSTNDTSAKAEAAVQEEAEMTPEALQQIEDDVANAVLDAVKQMQAEAQSTSHDQTRVTGYDGPVFNDTLPPDAKYDPAQLPLANTGSTPTSEEEWHATLVHGRSVQEPVYHKAVYGIPVANVHFRSYHRKYLDFFTHFASHAAASLGIPISKVVNLPTQRSLWTVPRSPFAHKKSQENFERRTHKRAIKAWDAHPVVVERWVQYLRTHAMPGVGVKVTKWNHLPLGVGESRLQKLKKAMQKTALPADKIKAVAEKIVAKESQEAATEKATA